MGVSNPSAVLAEILVDLGDRLLEWREAGHTEGTWQDAQFKAAADLRAHRFLVDRLGAGWPGVPVLSEEDDLHAEARPPRYWLIDPIDGTASWAGGYPGFVTQAALMEEDRPVLSGIYAPALGRLYTATSGGGALLNGAPLRVAPRGTRRLLIDNYPQPRGFAAAALAGLACTGYVECGSLALKMCRVLDGTADLFLKDVVVRDWDMAAPALIVQEAGGTFLRLDGSMWPFTGPMTKTGGIVTAASWDVALQAVTWYKQGFKA